MSQPMMMSTLVWAIQILSDPHMRTRQEAQRLYSFAYNRGWRRRLWLKLRGCSTRLLSLGKIRTTYTIGNTYYAERQTVPLAQIRGSQGRCQDFDDAFYPLNNHNRERWLRLAAAHYSGVFLPPVELIQVGEVYFVRDGHHRLSLARALEQPEIDAEVIVWQVSE